MTGTGVNDELDGSKSKTAVKFTVSNQDIPRGIVLSEEQIEAMPKPHEMTCEIVQVDICLYLLPRSFSSYLLYVNSGRCLMSMLK